MATLDEAADPAGASSKSRGADRVGVATRLGFGVGDFAFNLFWSGTGLFLLYFYTDVLGIDPVAAGAVYMVAMLWDAVTDPMMGVIADRTRTRWGRYRPYILFGAVPLAASYALAFYVPQLEGALLVGWALFTHCLLRTTYTIVSIPFSSMTATVSPSSTERSSIAGARMIGAATGALTVAIATPIAVKAMGPEGEATGYFVAACVVAVLSVFLFLFCFAVMKEPEIPPDQADKPVPTLGAELKGFFSLFRSNGPLVRVFLSIIVISVALTMFGKCVLYYFKYDLKAPEEAQVALIMPGLAMILAVPFWVWFAGRTSKRMTWMVGSLLAGTGYLAFYLNPVETVPVVLSIMVLTTLGGSAYAVMFWSMLPDTVEYGEANTGERHEAKVFGFASFAQKAALGINAMILGVMLKQTGFVANTELSQETLDGIKAIMGLVPFAGVVLSVVILWRYPIDSAYHTTLRERIAKRASLAQA
jgi:glycoside/pentoside/hexuronide:cation symporter, GPH family